MKNTKVFPFVDNPVCDKCGSNDVHWRFFEKLPKDEWFRRDIYFTSLNKYTKIAHHYMHCKRCQYEWLMKVKKEIGGKDVSVRVPSNLGYVSCKY